jgi:hypothetical protein
MPSRPTSQVWTSFATSPMTTVAAHRITLRGEALRFDAWGSGEVVITGSCKAGS